MILPAPVARPPRQPMARRFAPPILVVLSVAVSASGQEKEKKEPVFSGPQVGEKLPAFKVKGVLGDDAGKELDFVKKADGKPIVLVFVHDFNRMSLGFTRTLSQ